MQGATQYMMDAYQIYAASALAATVVMRSICACFFPLVIPIMYRRLGDHWAGTVFAILTALCMPLPWVFWVGVPYLVYWWGCADCCISLGVRACDTQPLAVCHQGRLAGRPCEDY